MLRTELLPGRNEWSYDFNLIILLFTFFVLIKSNKGAKRLVAGEIMCVWGRQLCLPMRTKGCLFFACSYLSGSQVYNIGYNIVQQALYYVICSETPR
jgi:hypothetical protein